MRRLDNPRSLAALMLSVAPLGLAVGCGSDVDDGDGTDPDFGPFDTEVCQYDATALSDLSLATAADYVALRQNNDFGGTDPEPVQVTAEWGVACNTAMDAAACAQALADLPIDTPLFTQSGQILTNYDLAITEGDNVSTITTRPDLLALLGSIDTAHEAALLAMVDGHSIGCSGNNVRFEDGTYTLLATSGSGCGEGIYKYTVTVNADGTLTAGDKVLVEEGDDNCAIGRRPNGLCTATRRARTVGAFFANAAHLEAASVYAFTHLAKELAAHGAPASLVRAALRARADEIRHARTTARLARRFGAEPKHPVVEERAVRSLFDVAIDNATEGCVRETFGAATAHVQARKASDRIVRRAMRTIAVDETRHADLSWEIDRWALSRLSTSDRRTLRQRRAQAVEQLRADSQKDMSAEVQALAGMPSAAAATRMLNAMHPALWS